MKKVKAEKSAVADAPLQQRTGAPDALKYIARGELFPDPDQPRKTFDEASLKELAESIASQGIVQPLIVRLVKAKWRILEPELHDKEYRVEELKDGHWYRAWASEQKDACERWIEESGNPGRGPASNSITDRYMIVAGERRWRAAEIAGLTELPCIVRDLDAHGVFAQQFIENEKRVNISALEEAEALTKQLESRKRVDAGFSVETLAKELGMSRAGLYQRLALTRLHAPVREALLAGKISTSVAGVVAIIPLPDQQEKLLKLITDEKNYQFPFSVRDVQEIVEEDYCKQLSAAPFDTKLTYGDSVNGLYDPCKECPHRTGNLVEQFPELAKRPNVCTRPDCFMSKCKAHWVAKSQDLAQKGKTVLVPKEFNKVKADYVRADKATPSTYGLFPGHYADAPEAVLGKAAPEPVYVATADGVEKYFKKADIPDAAKKAKVKMSERTEAKTETTEQKATREKAEAEAHALRERRQEFVKSQIPALLKALGKLKTAEAWALGVELVRNHDGYCDDDLDDASEAAKDPQTRVLGFLFADNDNSPLTYGGEWKEHGVKLWKRAGIDLKAGFEVSEKAAQKTMALPKAEPKQEKLIDVKPGKKKLPSGGAKAKIIAAQKARWAKVKATAKK